MKQISTSLSLKKASNISNTGVCWIRRLNGQPLSLFESKFPWHIGVLPTISDIHPFLLISLTSLSDCSNSRYWRIFQPLLTKQTHRTRARESQFVLLIPSGAHVHNLTRFYWSKRPANTEPDIGSSLIELLLGLQAKMSWKRVDLLVPVCEAFNWLD